GGTRVVGHAAVHRYVLPHAGDLFDRSDRIERRACITDDAAAGLNPDARQIKVMCLEPFLHRISDGLHIDSDWEWTVAFNITNAEPAAEIDDRQGYAETGFHFHCEISSFLRCSTEPFHFENLRTDMRVHPEQPKLRRSQHGLDRFEGAAVP